MSLFNSIWKDLEYGFRMGNMVRKLILVNVLVFVLVQILHLGANVAAGGMEGGYLIFWDILHKFCMPSDWLELLKHIWTPITSVFLHEGFWHLVGNMIWLSIFGTITGDLIGDQRVLPIYLMGGLAGGLLYFISANLMPASIGSHALGASAAVMAFGGASLMLAPDYRVGLMFLGEVKLKYIVLIMVLLDLVGVSGMPNAGGHAAHLGGFVFGLMFVYALRDRKDWSEPVNRLLNRIQSLFYSARKIGTNARPKPKMKVTHNRMAQQRPGPPPTGDARTHQEKLDVILDKIKQQGFDQLTQEEKDFLYDASKK
jgi:membrane associated rhomboid family serine protease